MVAHLLERLRGSKVVRLEVEHQLMEEEAVPLSILMWMVLEQLMVA